MISPLATRMISLGLGAPSTLPAAPSGESAITVGSVAGAAVAPGSSLGVLALESVEKLHYFFTCIIIKLTVNDTFSITYYSMSIALF